MDTFTQALWSVTSGSVELLQELHEIMRQEHKPFLNSEQAFEANTNLVKQHLLEKLTKWLEWLPSLPIDQIGAALVEEAFEFIEWEYIAKQLQEGLCRSKSVKK